MELKITEALALELRVSFFQVTNPFLRVRQVERRYDRSREGHVTRLADKVPCYAVALGRKRGKLQQDFLLLAVGVAAIASLR